MTRIEYTKQATKALMKMGRTDARRITDRVEMLADPALAATLDVKPLSGTDNRFRLRVGGWRVIYTASGLVLLIEKIGSRGDVYK